MNPQRLQQRSKLQSGLRDPKHDRAMAWRGHEASPPASPPRAGYDEAGPRYEAGHDGLDDLAVAALATLPPQKAASILTKLRNKGGNVRNPSAYVVRSIENAHCHGGGGSLRTQPPPGTVYYVPYYNYGPPPPPDQSPPGFAPSPARASCPRCRARGSSPRPRPASDERRTPRRGGRRTPSHALDPKASAAARRSAPSLKKRRTAYSTT